VYGLSDKVVTLETADGIKFKFLRSQIGGLLSQVLEEKTK
jgi:hypothetical protein